MIELDKIYQSKNHGEFRVIEYLGCFNVVIEFVTTGYRRSVRSECVRSGSVRDPFYPKVIGVGFYGQGKYKAKINGVDTIQYKAWFRMITRCYCPKYHKTRPSYIDCSVTPDWHNFQNFAKWFDENYIKDYHLDKDIKIKGNRVYSPDTCMFVSPAENTIEASAKHYVMINPDGEAVNIYNMSEFCRGTDLRVSSMCAVHKGRERTYKGWTKA